MRNRKTQNADNHHHHLQVGYKAPHSGIRHLGTNIGKNGTLTGCKTKSGGTKGKNDNDNDRFILQIASGNCWRERESQLLSKVDLRSNSICSLA